MMRQQNIKSRMAVAFTSLYLFAFLFSANFHQHNAGYFYKDFQFKSASKNFSQQNAVNNSDDCLSCHFASEGIVLPSVSNFTFSTPILKVPEFSVYSSGKASSPYFLLHLRGPPAII